MVVVAAVLRLFVQQALCRTVGSGSSGGERTNHAHREVERGVIIDEHEGRRRQAAVSTLRVL
jgi:hypothetical protein